MKLKILLIITFPFFVFENIVKSYSFQYIYDTGINSPDFSLEYMFKILFVVILILAITYFLGYVYETVKVCLIQKKIEDNRNSLLKSFVTNYHKTKKNEPSFHLNMISNDLILLNDNYYKPIYSLIENIFIFIFSCIAVFIISPVMLISILLLFMPVFIIPKVFAKSLNKRTNQYSQDNTLMLKKVTEYLNGIDVINQFRITSEIIEKSKVIFKKVYTSITKLRITENISDYLVTIIANSVFVFEISFGIYLYSKGVITIGQQMAIIQLSNTIINPISNIVLSLNQIKSVKDVKGRIEQTTLQDKNTKYKKAFYNGINVTNLTYEINDKVILDQVNFQLEENDHILLDGANGSGKSTLCKIISDRIDGYIGDVRLDSENLIYIDQEGFIFDESILYNITLGQKYSKTKLDNIIEECRLLEMIETRGLEFECGENGKKLSGGEKQKIVLARALLYDKKYYMLDESLNAIDKNDRKKIESYLFKKKDKAFIYISHFSNENIECFFNKRIVMNEGKLVENNL